MKEISIRKYIESDEISIVNMTVGKYADELKGFSRENLMIAEYNGNIAGYSYISSRSKGYFYVFIYVSAEYRRNNIGTQLYFEIEKKCLSSECVEVFTNYYEENGATEFVKKLGATYVTSSDIMKYSGEPICEREILNLIFEKGLIIRQYKDEDYLRFHYLWSYGIYEMHKRIGIPVTEPFKLDEAYRDEYHNDINNLYVLEENGHIVGVGGILGNSIGLLAVDTHYNNLGYGTLLTKYLTTQIFQRKHTEAHITCETGNDNALHIYEKIGYKKLYTDYWAIKKF